MKRLSVVLVLFATLGVLVQAEAEITPIIVRLQSTPQRPLLTYDVPEGKILVIEHVWGSEAIAGIDITIQQTKVTMPLQAGPLSTSLKLGPTWHLEAPITLTVQDIYLLGYLADPKDLAGGPLLQSNILSGIELR